MLAAAFALPLRAQTTEYFATRYAGAEHANVDGPLASARFNQPAGLAMDHHGNLFVADTGNHTVRMITPGGLVTTLAGSPGESGMQNGTGAEARFREPARLCVDREGNVYVSSLLGHMVQKITPAGVVSTAIGTDELSDGNLYGTAIDSAGTFYLALSWPGIVRKRTAGGVTSTVATHATRYPLVGVPLSGSPEVIATDINDNLYVFGYGDIAKISPSGVGTIIRPKNDYTMTWGSFGVSLAVNSVGSIFIADQFGVTKMAPDGTATRLAVGRLRSGYDAEVTAEVGEVQGLVIDATGNLYVSDRSGVIQKITTAGPVTNFAGAPARYLDGPAEKALFSTPGSLTIDRWNNVYVADANGQIVRKIDSNRMVTTLAGKAAWPVSSVDGQGEAARFTHIRDMVVDETGTLYLTDSSAKVIRKITPDGVATTLAGMANVFGTTDGTGTEARFREPIGLAIDGLGNLFVGDAGAIRKITPAGVVTTLAGVVGQTGAVDGIGAEARFGWTIHGLVFDRAGNLYVSDKEGRTIRKITPSGVVSTFAGSSGPMELIDGLGTAARFLSPTGLVIDASDNLLVRDGSAIRKVTPTGLVTTVALVPLHGSSLYSGIALDSAGNIYVTNSESHGVTKLSRPGTTPTIVSQPRSRTVNADDALQLSISADGAPLPIFQWQHNGRAIPGANQPSIWLAAVQPADTGLYSAAASIGAAQASSSIALVGLTTTSKVIGDGTELSPHDIRHPNGNIFDQVLLEGAAASITADYSPDPTLNQITRISFIDIDDDIVQVEFSGPGTLSLVLDSPTGQAPPINYHQGTHYMKGHAGIVIAGATERTNVSVFSVGRANAVNKALFKDDVNYDGIADLAFIAVSSANGRFGGVRTANANFYATQGLTGIHAPGVVFEGPVYVGNISAFATATPVLQLGYAADVRITGGDLAQPNEQPVQVSGIEQLKFVAGSDSHGNLLARETNQGVLIQDRVDVTSKLVVYP